MSQAANTFWTTQSVAAITRVNARVRRRARVRRLIDAVVWAVILSATGMCFSVYYRARAELATAITKHQRVVDRVGDVKKEIHQLELEIHQLRSDPRMIESIARSQLGFIRPGEIVIRLGRGDDEEGLRSELRSQSGDSARPDAKLSPAAKWSPDWNATSRDKNIFTRDKNESSRDKTF